VLKSMDTATKHNLVVDVADGLEMSDFDRLKDSVWYDGLLFFVEDPITHAKVSVSAVGEIQIHDHRKKYEGNIYRSGYALANDGDVVTDKHLFQLQSKQLLVFANNNWFECYDESSKEIFSNECVHGTPKEALGCATEYLLEKRKEAEPIDDTELWEG
jgi:hypothetical protein